MALAETSATAMPAPRQDNAELKTLVQAFDWAQTPLGARATWSQSLQTTVNICLHSRYPIILFWGPDLVQIYNDAYRPILGATKHPAALGQRANECWPEVWDVIGPMLQSVLTTGQATWADDLLLLLERYGYVEECYFTFSYSPVIAEQGAVAGVFCAVTETTLRVMGERRLQTLRDLASVGAQAQTDAEACQGGMAVLASNPADIPFALLYLLDTAGSQATLMGTVRLSPDTPASPWSITLAEQGIPLPGVWPLAQVARTSQAVVVSNLTEQFDDLPGGIWPDAPHTALVLPIAAPGQERPAGLLVVGISPRQALDDAYRGFLELVVGHLASALANARAHAAERQRAEALSELNRAKTAFFSNVSHEFRTPLTLMLGLVEDLLDDPDLLAPDVSEQLAVVHRNGLRLLKLVNTLLDFARIEAGRIAVSYAPTDLALLTTDLASVFRSAIERAGLRLVVDCPPLPKPAYVDREMWERIVLNLLSNALKFTFEGEVRVAQHQVGKQIVLAIQDTGVGIAPADQTHIFDRFHRIRGVQARTHEGTGIGLALVQELVRLHGGSIVVSSHLGQGSTFVVTIPTGSAHLSADRIQEPLVLATPAQAAVPYVEEALRWLPTSATVASNQAQPAVWEERSIAAFAPVRTPDAAHPRPHILLADDNADLRDYLVRLLQREYQVTAVADGLAALEMARAQLPNLVVTDVMMPGLDGFALLRTLRDDPQARTIPIILLSARAGEEARVEGLELGADDYLIKPFSARELLARIRTHLELAAVRRAAAERERELRQEAEAARAIAEEAVRVREAFMSVAAHELKNPLTPLFGQAQLLRRRLSSSGTLNERDQRAIQTIIEQSRRLVRMIDTLLDLSRLERGKLTITRQPVDLWALVQRIVADLQPTLSRHTVTCYATDASLVVQGDELRLEQVLQNLLSNAIKYSPDGGSVRVHVGQRDTGVSIAVSDEGIGIPTHVLPHLFRRFYRADTVEAQNITGIGIGLYIVKEIVELHSGMVSVESIEGHGSTFTVWLPQHPPQPAE